jgi:hypothetical protein
MAFPRRFKKETWYLRLPSGEVEIATATALQRAFECGLIDLRTPVRAFGTHVWITMQEAAELSPPASRLGGSLSPTALDSPAPDLASGAIWSSRSDVDPERFKPSRIPAIVVLLASAAFVCLVLVGETARGPSTSAALQQFPTAAPTTMVKLAPPPIRERLHTPSRDTERLTKEQKHRLAELDYVTRTQRPTSSLARPLVSKTATRSPNDPFSRTAFTVASRGDPLDGSL